MRCKDEEIAWAAEYVRNMSLFAFFHTPEAYCLWKEKQTLLGVGVKYLVCNRSSRVDVRGGSRIVQYVKKKG